MSNSLKLFFLASIPTLITAFLLILFIVPKNISGISGVMPLVHLVPIYIWSVLHARHMPLSIIAIFGLIVDSVAATPFGLSALIYFGFVILIRSQRKYILKEGFFGLWGYFSLSILFMQISFWVAISLIHQQFAPISSGLLQAVFSTLTYPLLHVVLYPLVDKIADTRYRLLHA